MSGHEDLKCHPASSTVPHGESIFETSDKLQKSQTAINLSYLSSRGCHKNFRYAFHTVDFETASPQHSLIKNLAPLRVVILARIFAVFGKALREGHVPI